MSGGRCCPGGYFFYNGQVGAALGGADRPEHAGEAPFPFRADVLQYPAALGRGFSDDLAPVAGRSVAFEQAELDEPVDDSGQGGGLDGQGARQRLHRAGAGSGDLPENHDLRQVYYAAREVVAVGGKHLACETREYVFSLFRKLFGG